MKNIVINKYLEKINSQAKIIFEQAKEIEKIKGNFEKIIKKNDKQNDLSMDSMIKKESDIHDLIPSLDVSANIHNLSNDNVLYQNKNKILRNITSRINKITKSSQQTMSQSNLNGSEVSKEISVEPEAFHKKIDFGKITKDGNSSINIERIDSLESVSKYSENKENEIAKRGSKVQVSQSPIRNSDKEIEKELKKLETNEKKRKSYNAKGFKESIFIIKKSCHLRKIRLKISGKKQFLGTMFSRLQKIKADLYQRVKNI
jgi:hypothetical protein